MARVINRIREPSRSWPRVFVWPNEQITAKVELGEAALVSPITRLESEFFLSCLEEPFKSVMELYMNGVRPTQIAKMLKTSKYDVTRRLAVGKVTIRTMYAVWQGMLKDRAIFVSFMRGKQCEWCREAKAG